MSNSTKKGIQKCKKFKKESRSSQKSAFIVHKPCVSKKKAILEAAWARSRILDPHWTPNKPPLILYQTPIEHQLEDFYQSI